MRVVREGETIDEQHDNLGSAQSGWLSNLFPNLRDAAIRWSEDDAGSLAASVAYYLALSLFPMLLLLTTGIGLFLQFTTLGQDAQQQLLDTVAQHGSPVIEEQVSQVLQQIKKKSVVGGPVGTLTAILAAIGVFAQLDRGFDRVWRIPSRKGQSLQRTIISVLHHRMLAFCMLLCLGGMVVTLFVAQMALTHIRSMASTSVPVLSNIFQALQFSFIVAANALLFGMVYKWLPKKEVGWTEALRGGMLAAVIWELGRVVLGMFLIGMQYTSAYGVIGSFIAILLWCYYGMSIVFFGAEYVQVLQRRKQDRLEALVTLALPESSSNSESIPALTESESKPVRIRPRNRRV
ncbi:MAG: YihY/virulence factor BrkB family protein [Pirellulaceae bacterium]|nr:YihY/virulence factor BrkB family protein [Pirellulaceae bacterium]